MHFSALRNSCVLCVFIAVSLYIEVNEFKTLRKSCLDSTVAIVLLLCSYCAGTWWGRLAQGLAAQGRQQMWQGPELWQPFPGLRVGRSSHPTFHKLPFRLRPQSFPLGRQGRQLPDTSLGGQYRHGRLQHNALHLPSCHVFVRPRH